MRIKSYNKTSPGQRAKIETECDLVYFTDGISIGKKLVYNVLGSSVYGLAHNQIGGNKKVFIANADYVRGSFNRIRNYLIFINAEIVYDPIDTELFCKTNQEILWMGKRLL